MPRKKATQPESELLPIDLFQALSAAQDDTDLGDFDEAEAVYAAMEFSKSLLSFAHELANQAIQIQGFETEADRIAASKRQVILTGELFAQFQAVTLGTQN